MAFRCAIELGIPAAIHRHGGAAPLLDLLTELSIPPSNLPFLRRLMRLLTTSGVFAANDTTEAGVYRLTPLSRLLVDEAVGDGHTGQTYSALGATARLNVEATFGLADWFKMDAAVPPVSPFEATHGAGLFDEGRIDPEFARVLNEGMASCSRFGVSTALYECRSIFEGLHSLIDCGGGDGTTARAIVKTFPKVTCTVLDLKQVINTIPADGVVNYVAGDMFKFIPPAQAVLLQHVLHFWSDEECAKILAKCKEAIP